MALIHSSYKWRFYFVFAFFAALIVLGVSLNSPPTQAKGAMNAKIVQRPKPTPTPQAPSSQISYTRDVTILGWSGTGKQLLFQEKTLNEAELSMRAAVLDTQSGQVIRNLQLQEPHDPTKEISEREKELGEFMQHGQYQKGISSPFFIGAKQSGFLSPDGHYLLTAEFSFKPRKKDNDLQSLKVDLYAQPLPEGSKERLAEMELDSIDGEHPLNADSVGSISVNQIEWSPRGAIEKDSDAAESKNGERANMALRPVAVILEEKRALYRVKGVIALNLPELPEPSIARLQSGPAIATPSESVVAEKKSAAVTIPRDKPQEEENTIPLPKAVEPTPTPKKAEAKATPPRFWDEPQASSSSADSVTKKIEKYYLPQGGQAQFLQWETAHITTSADGNYTAVQHFYRACKETKGAPASGPSHIFSSNLSIVDKKQDGVLSYSFSPKLNPEKMTPAWKGNEIEVRYSGEVLRNFSVSPEKFAPGKSPHEAFALQLGAFSNRATAVSEVEKLCHEGIPAYFLVSADGGANAERYRLRVGRFDNEAKARQYANENIKGHFPKFLVTAF